MVVLAIKYPINVSYVERKKMYKYTKKDPLLFRFHRGGLKESMDTVIKIRSYKHLLDSINDSFWPWGIEINKIEIKPYVYDPRIDWDTYMVNVHHEKLGQYPVPVGYLNKNPGFN
jgi:hypothetical protein